MDSLKEEDITIAYKGKKYEKLPVNVKAKVNDLVLIVYGNSALPIGENKIGEVYKVVDGKGHTFEGLIKEHCTVLNEDNAPVSLYHDQYQVLREVEDDKMEKVKLPKDVAESIEGIRSGDGDNRHVLEEILNDRPVTKESETVYKYAKDHLDTILKALVNGYEVELTPEEKVREYWDKMMKSRYSCKNEIQLDNIESEIAGIEKTLELLEIEIEGINK